VSSWVTWGTKTARIELIVNECKPLLAGVGRVGDFDVNAEELHLVDADGRGIQSSTSQLNLSRVGHKKTPYTPYTPPNTRLTWATQPQRAPPIPYKALKLS